ncbi:MAG: hypothetical protein K1X29_03500 [Bdellovibrionales bacterium]|nr:hypothetical protein [Bdellovibrionales bacterium]
MAHLDRYKKTGGFLQLLTLIESFAPAKREKFLALIETENQNWSAALRQKLLTPEKIFNWPPHIWAEIVPKVPVNILVIAIHNLQPEQSNRLLSGLPNTECRKIQLEKDMVKPSPNEVITTQQKIVETVRKMVNDGELRLEQFDSSIMIDERFEENLLQTAKTLNAEPKSLQMETSLTTEPIVNQEQVRDTVKEQINSLKNIDNKSLVQDLKSMQTLLLNLQKENKQLRSDLKTAKEKLEMIRKIA